MKDDFNSPAVSVVIPTYNRSELVGVAVRSVLDQTDVTVEVIVVDDHSTDDTMQILDGFGGRIHVLQPPVNSERGAARNMGARAASTDLIAFLDSDDVWEPQKLATQLRTGAECSVTGLTFIDGGGRPQRTYIPPRSAHRSLPWRNEFLGAPSSMVLSRKAFEDSGGFPEERSLQGSEDWIFLMRLHRAGVPIHIVPHPLVRYRVHADNSTGDVGNVARSMWGAVLWMEGDGLLTPELARRCRGNTAAVIARQYAATGDLKSSASWALKAMSNGRRRDFVAAPGLVLLSTVKALWRALRTKLR